jgi:hypothetical protein
VNRTEVAALLTLCARYDQRTLGEEDVEAWYDLLHDLDSTDAIDSVRGWYRQHPEQIRPASVRAGAAKLRADRLARLVELPPPADLDPDDVERYIGWLRDSRRQAADGGAVRSRPVGPALDRMFRRPPALPQ